MAETFLERLGLDDSCNERDIRRAYALELKKIDQESDIAAFQLLRASYEAALQWVRQPQTGNTWIVADSDWAGTLPTSAEPESECQHAPETATENLPDCEPPLLANLREDAHQVFDLFQREFSDLCRESVPALDSVLTLLRHYRAHEQLLNSQALHRFEVLCAERIAAGWQSGHDMLFAACSQCFEWDSDRALEQRLGTAGTVITGALNERAVLDSPSNKDRAQQLRALQALAGEALPPDPELPIMIHTLEQMRHDFPTYLKIVARLERLSAWQGRWKSLPPERRQQLVQQQLSGIQEPENAYVVMLWKWLLVFLSLFLVYLVRG